MTIRKILVPFATGAGRPDAPLLAMAVARRFDAHVDVLFLRPDPRAEVLMQRAEAAGMVEEFWESVRAYEERLAADAHQQFVTICNDLGLPIVDRPDRPARLGAAWQELAGGRDLLSRIVAAEARVSDLVVVGQVAAGNREDAHLVRDAVLMTSGRPVLSAPPMPPLSTGQTCVVAWNGRREAALAVAGAMPFLTTARRIEVVTAETGRTEGKAGEKLADYLALHGVHAGTTVLRPGLGNVGRAILEKVMELGADLLIMGGFGHSRFREFFLGGVTRHVLDHSGAPVLIVH